MAYRSGRWGREGARGTGGRFSGRVRVAQWQHRDQGWQQRCDDPVGAAGDHRRRGVHPEPFLGTQRHAQPGPSRRRKGAGGGGDLQERQCGDRRRGCGPCRRARTAHGRGGGLRGHRGDRGLDRSDRGSVPHGPYPSLYDRSPNRRFPVRHSGFGDRGRHRDDDHRHPPEGCHRQGGRGTRIELEPFRHDIVIRLTVDEA